MELALLLVSNESLNESRLSFHLIQNYNLSDHDFFFFQQRKPQPL